MIAPDDPYAAYVMAAYGATVVIIGATIWMTLRRNARVREELEQHK
ncbi:MAG: heme exporter protein CcmD [Pseudomonadota bacterium]